jgi:hypothetical protein
MSEATEHPTGNTGIALMIMAGGLCAGVGIMTLLFGFEPQGGQDFAEQISTIGFNGLPFITVKAAGKIGVGLIVTGIALMVFGNSQAYKSTGGY